MKDKVLISLDKVGKQFGQSEVLQEVSLNIRENRIITLIGPNGAGKTTLVRIVLGLLAPDRGVIQRAPQLKIGYMPQKLSLEPTMPLSVKRFLQFAEPDLKLCQEALARTGIPGLMENPVQALSGGETQRMLLARALLRKPNLLVLDEPVQGVDVSGQEELYQLIANLRHELNCGIFMVSHDLHLVMAATDEVVCLNQHVCCSGSPQQVSINPAFVELFGAKTALYTHHHDHHHDLHSGIIADTDGVGATAIESPTDSGPDHGHL